MRWHTLNNQNCRVGASKTFGTHVCDHNTSQILKSSTRDVGGVMGTVIGIRQNRRFRLVWHPFSINVIYRYSLEPAIEDVGGFGLKIQ